MGSLVIISSPSGGGKDSVINALLQRIPKSTRVITTTSRPPRPGNENGVDYFFISKDEFERRIAASNFLEYNFYAGNYYGEEKQEVEKKLSSYAIVFTQIDVNGKHHLDALNFPHLSIFLVPENLDVLRKRIAKRGGITAAGIEERLAIARREIANSKDYDYRITNVEGKLSETIETIAKIIEKYQQKTETLDKKAKNG